MLMVIVSLLVSLVLLVAVFRTECGGVNVSLWYLVAVAGHDVVWVAYRKEAFVFD